MDNRGYLTNFNFLPRSGKMIIDTSGIGHYRENNERNIYTNMDKKLERGIV